jgi:DNA-binding transcriptional ArsR family regulator
MVLVADTFKALADPTRRTILDELTARNGQTLFELCGRLITNHGLAPSRQAISQHLNVLEAAGLIETRREGRYKFHYINTAPLEPIIGRWRITASTDAAGNRGGTGGGAGNPSQATAPAQGEHHEDPPDERAR